jgi:leucyl-tRNA synthetase
MVHKDGEVMSKSKGNTVAPDDVVKEYGADTLRLYILSVAPPELHMEWSTENIAGSHRLVQRVWRFVDRHADALAKEPRAALPAELPEPARTLRRKVHQTILRVTEEIEERFHLNNAVAAFHELANEMGRLEAEVAEGPGRIVWREAVETLVLLTSPFTPHVAEEMWQELAVQVNGKVRGRITVPREAPESDIRRLALEEPRVKEHLDGKEVVKAVVVPGRLVSLVVR